MREITLSRGCVALVDDEDYEWLAQWKWRTDGVYAVRTEKRDGAYKIVTMHGEILPLGAGLEPDHKNRNGLDNQRANLRPATRQQNVWNRGFTRRRAGYRGVYPKGRKWCAMISVDGVQRRLGGFASAIEAALAYDRAAAELQGDFAVLNFSSDRDWLIPVASRSTSATPQGGE